MLLALISTFVFLGIFTNTNGLTVKGKVLFPANGEPDSLDGDSWLTVKIEDTSMMDAPSVVLGKDVTQVSNYKKGEPITFEVNDVNVSKRATSISISAVLNVGWDPKKQPGDWIHKGDYHTDTHTSIEFPSNEQSIVKDVPVVLLD